MEGIREPEKAINHQTPSSVATDKGPPKASAIDKSNLNSEKRVEFVAQAEFQKYIYGKVEDPQLASKNQVVPHVPSRRFVAHAAAPLCPRGSWKAICCIFFVASFAAIILFIIDIIRNIK